MRLRRINRAGTAGHDNVGSRTELEIELLDVGKDYVDPNDGRSFRALEGVDLGIARGEFVSIIGPSGCGKTTLLKIVDGLVPYDEGICRVGDHPVQGPGIDRAVVFQNFALLPWLTVRKNVAFSLSLRGIRARAADEVVDRCIAAVGLTKFQDSFPAQLSGGMQQRVGLARALAVDPSILLMDEPFGAVDSLTRQFLQDDLLNIWEASGKSVLFVTHDIAEATYLSDRIVVMGTGPGHVAEIVSTDLPRPRGDATRKSARYVDVCAYLWSSLRGLTGGIDRDEASRNNG